MSAKPFLKLCVVTGLLAVVHIATAMRIASATSPMNQSEQTIRQLEAQLSKAVVVADAAVFDRLLADDFTHTSHSGQFRNKAEWMADLRRGGTKYASFNTNDLSVRVYGDTAVVTGRSTPSGTNSHGHPIEGQYRYLRVWIQRDGHWQVVAFQGTRIADSPPAEAQSSSKRKEAK